MRRRTGAFRPTAGEPLEARTVPTGLGGFLGGLIGGVVPLPQQDAFAVRRDFAAFEQTYIKDVRTILAPVGGTSAPSGNVAAFNAAIGTAIGTLNTAITKDLGNLTVNGPAEVADDHRADRGAPDLTGEARRRRPTRPTGRSSPSTWRP